MQWEKVDTLIWEAAVKMCNKNMKGKYGYQYSELKKISDSDNFQEEIASNFVLYLKDTNNNTSSGITYSMFLNENIITITMRARLSNNFKSFISHEYQKITREKEKKMENRKFQTIQEVRNFDIKKVIDYAVDGSEDKLLIMWQMDLIGEDEVMEALCVSRRTLYRKWNDLKEELKNGFNKVTGKGE